MRFYNLNIELEDIDYLNIYGRDNTVHSGTTPYIKYAHSNLLSHITIEPDNIKS